MLPPVSEETLVCESSSESSGDMDAIFSPDISRVGSESKVLAGLARIPTPSLADIVRRSNRHTHAIQELDRRNKARLQEINATNDFIMERTLRLEEDMTVWNENLQARVGSDVNTLLEKVGEQADTIQGLADTLHKLSDKLVAMDQYLQISHKKMEIMKTALVETRKQARQEAMDYVQEHMRQVEADTARAMSRLQSNLGPQQMAKILSQQ